MHKHHHVRHFRAMLILVLMLVALLVFIAGRASAVQIEKADRPVEMLAVSYIERIPGPGALTRTYFELNNGTAWVYRGYGPCARANHVSNILCRAVFWYTR